MHALEIAIIFALFLVNGFFAGSELAIVSARKTRLQALATRGSGGARAALKLLDDPTRFLSSVQIGITLIGVLTGIYSGAALAGDLAVALRASALLAPYAEEIAYTAIVLCVTYASLILGELVPKRVALAHAESIAIFVAAPMTWIAKGAAPLVWVLRVSTEAVMNLLPVKSAGQSSVTEDDLRALVATGAQQGVLHRRERELIERVLLLADRSVESTMVPRGDVVWLDVDEPLEQLWEEARDSGHARFLLCEGALDHLLGVITLADLGEALRHGGLDREKYVRPPLFVPISLSLLRLLDLFRTSSVHLAIVADEYGGIEGIVTPVDLLKAIAGEIADLGSRERAEAVRGDEYHTVAGLVLWHLGRLPSPGQKLRYRDLEIEVLDMDGPRIDALLVTKAKAAARSRDRK
jgi:putative hemolysin